MIDYIPLHLYTDIFNCLVLALIMLVLFESFSDRLFKPETKGINNIIAVLVIIVVVLYMGLRPVSFRFGDTVVYAESFYRLQMNTAQFRVLDDGEWVFNTIMLWFANYSNVHYFFLFCAAIYVGALALACRRIFKEDFFVPLVVAMGMFFFWAYGVNGVRNGMAASIIILALTFRKNIPVMVVLFILGLGVHKSLYLVLAAASIALFIKDHKIFLGIWVSCIIISLVAGNSVASMIAGSGIIGDDRFASYVSGNHEPEVVIRTDFRWDFLLYSAMPVGIGYYFISQEKYKDKFYIWLFNIYLMTNAFWIIVIRASFSNRFAQISWFLIPLVIIYPLFMKKFWEDQSVKVGYVVAISYLYTFYLEFID